MTFKTPLITALGEYNSQIARYNMAQLLAKFLKNQSHPKVWKSRKVSGSIQILLFRICSASTKKTMHLYMGAI